MNNPLAIIAIVICTAFFGQSWSVTIGHWLDVAVLDLEGNFGSRRTDPAGLRRRRAVCDNSFRSSS